MNVRLKHDMQFVAGVYYNNTMRMNNYNLRIWMTTTTSVPENHSIAFERIKYFVYNEIDSTVFINQAYNDQCLKYLSSGLNITTLPGEPVDQLIGIMLFHKLDAIVEDRMMIEEIEVSSVLGENIVYLHSENENTDLSKYPEWWTTPDLNHCDTTVLDGDKVVVMRQGSAWHELDLSWPEQEENTQPGNTVVFADFKKTDE